ncbi:hypothetical protein KP509_31G059500 [Ceratopteris richardii]|nr:hypothetical protein KP509_31G059500 [Ceratopteris richardii]
MEGIEENRSVRASDVVENSVRFHSVTVDAGISKEQSASSNLPRDHPERSAIDSDKSCIRAAGCPHCFMYVLPSRSNPNCPKCKSSILVDLSPFTFR